MPDRPIQAMESERMQMTATRFVYAKATLALGCLGLVFGWVMSPMAYYPGAPDRNLSVLQTAEITPNQNLFTRFDHRFDDPISPQGENNPFYNLLGMDGGANIYFDLGFGLGNLGEVTLGRERENKTYGLEGKLQAWNQRVDHRPLSLALTGNVQVRTDRGIEAAKRASLGGSLIVSRSFREDQFEIVTNTLFQSHTNIAETLDKPDHSLAVGLGGIWRLDRLSFFAEGIFPLHLGDFGYRRTYPGRASNGIPLQGYGFNYRIYNHSFALTVTNYTSIFASNYIVGAHTPGPDRLNDWRLGFNLTRSFKVGH
jgi:hypothetical protein